jgi:MFS family permease
VIPGVLAVALLIHVPEPRDGAHRPARLPLSREGLAQLGRGYWRLVALGGVIALARFSEAFLLLRAAERGLPITYVPLVLVVMSGVYALTAYPAGRLSDRLPRSWLLALGMAILAVADVALALADGYALLFAGIALWGLHMGLTQGILASMITDVAPAAYRATAFGAFNLVSGAGLLLASAATGFLWDQYGAALAFWVGSGIASIAAVLALLSPPTRPEVD